MLQVVIYWQLYQVFNLVEQIKSQKLVRGAFNRQPCLLKLSSIWDVKGLFDLFRLSAKYIYNLQIKILTHKLAILLILSVNEKVQI